MFISSTPHYGYRTWSVPILAENLSSIQNRPKIVAVKHPNNRMGWRSCRSHRFYIRFIQSVNVLFPLMLLLTHISICAHQSSNDEMSLGKVVLLNLDNDRSPFPLIHEWASVVVGMDHLISGQAESPD